MIQLFNGSIRLILKDIVNDNIKSANKVEYQYRIYAYAIMENGDTNVSNYSPGISKA